ncbi:MAG: response regulator [Myxococcota bacterium]
MAASSLRLCAVDDDATLLKLLERFVDGLGGVELRCFQNPEAALRHVREHAIDVLLVDLNMPEMSGREVLRRSVSHVPELPVVIMTSDAEVETAVELMRLGARDYLTKPLKRPLFVQRVVRLGEEHQLRRELDRLRAPVGIRELIGHSAVLQDVRRRIQKLANGSGPVWLCGPAGAGLDRVGLALHQSAARRDGPFVARALSGGGPEREATIFGRRLGAFAHESERLPGLLEQARGGTLMLDWAAAPDQGLHRRILRFIEEHGRGPRLVHTVESGSSLPAWLPSGADVIKLPALRERPSDIGFLARHIVERLNRRFLKACYLTRASIELLEAQLWPRNLEELTQVLETAVLASAGPITQQQLRPGSVAPAADKAPGAYKAEKAEILDAFEKDYLHRLLVHEAGHLSRAAVRAGIDRKNLWQLLKKHGVEASAFKPESSSSASSQPRNRRKVDHG